MVLPSFARTPRTGDRPAGPNARGKNAAWPKPRRAPELLFWGADRRNAAQPADEPSLWFACLSTLTQRFQKEDMGENADGPSKFSRRRRGRKRRETVAPKAKRCRRRYLWCFCFMRRGVAPTVLLQELATAA